MRMRKNGRGGYTLLEVVIASAILIAVCFMVFMLLFTSSSQGATQQTKVAMDAKVLEVINIIAEDIRNSGGNYSTLDAGGVDTYLQGNPPLAVADTFYNPNVPAADPTQRRYSLTMGQYSGFSSATKQGQALYANTVRYYWKPAFGEIPDNGKDDNGDGLVDEGVIIREQTVGGVMTPSTICRNVSPRGLAFEFVQGKNPPFSIKIFVELMGLDSKGKLMKSQSESAAGPRTH